MIEKDMDVFKIDDTNREAQREHEKRRARDIDDLQKTLKTPEGRRLIRRILEEAGIFRASFSQNSMLTAFNEGKRDVGLWLIRDIDESDPNMYAQIQREYYSELKSKKAKQEEEPANA
jgi:hypothetical protein